MTLSVSNCQDKVKEIADLSTGKPFDPLLIKFAVQFSKNILLDEAFRGYPELMAMGHWLRAAQINEFQRVFLAKDPKSSLMPRGLALHFAPSNVDTIFVYSWIISLLVGNKNVVRLSQKRAVQIDLLLQLIDELLNLKEFYLIKQRTLFLSYAHDEAITRFLSSHCQVRVIWGGDETICHIRSIPLPPLATEIIFPDRYSLAVLRASKVLLAKKDEQARLVKNFYNDALWFDQAACSSPRSVIWIGETEEVEEAKSKFWPYLPKRPSFSRSQQLATTFHYAALNHVSRLDGNLESDWHRLQIATWSHEMRKLHLGGGVFLEIIKERLEDLYDILSEKDQTIGVYGFERQELVNFVEHLPIRSVDRIVPIGQMLNFYPVWDGYNLFHAFSREVSVW